MNIDKKIDFPSMELPQIFEVILRDVALYSDALYCVVNFNVKGKDPFYGYDSEHDEFVWLESAEDVDLPIFIQNISSKVSSLLKENYSKPTVVQDNILFTALSYGCNYGYLAVKLKDNIKSVEYFVNIAEYIVSVLDKKDICDKAVLLEKQKSLTKMLSMIVHDMRNPICGVSGYVQLIEQKSDDKHVITYAKNILETIDELERSNNELLAFVHGSLIDLSCSDFSVVDFIKELIELNSDSYKYANIAVNVSGDENIEIFADRKHFGRAISNILQNAKKSLDEDGGNIDISVIKNGNNVRITIQDNGSGIPFYVMDKIFEPFFTYNNADGIGLGLTIAKNIIKRHNGTIDVQSTLKKNTVFKINLPINQGDK